MGFNVPAKIIPKVDESISLAPPMGQHWQKVLSLFRGGGIRRRLLTWGLCLFWSALLIVIIAGYFYTERQIRLDAAALQSELAVVTAERIRNFVRRKIERFADNAAALSLYSLGSNEQRLLLSLLVKNDSSFTHASIINAQGMEVVKVSDRKVYFPSDLSDQSQSAKFIKARQGEAYISGVSTSDRAQPYITLAIPLWGAAQSVAGVVSAETDLSFLWEVIGKIRFGTAGYAYLIDEQGNLIAHKDAALVTKRMKLGQVDGVQKFLRNPTRADHSPALQGTGLNGDTVLATYAPVPEMGWSVVLEEPIDAALASVQIAKRSALALLLAGLFVGATLIVWLSQKITKPIEELRQNVATIGAGNLEHRADIRTGDEIEELATEFNKMASALQQSHATLEQKVDQRTREITALYSITTAVNQSLALKDILDAVLAKIAEIFAFESTRVYLLNHEMNELELAASYERELKHPNMRRTYKLGEGVVGRVAQSGEALVFEDTRTNPLYAQVSATKAKYITKQSFFAVFPIKTRSRVLGAILFNARLARKLTGDETRLLTSMSEHLAVAVEKATLYRQSETRAQQLSVLNKIGAAVSQSLDLDTVLNEAIEKMIDALHFDAAWVYVLDQSGEEFSLITHKGLTDDVARTIARRQRSTGVTSTIFATGKRLVFEDFQNDHEYQNLSSRKTIISMGFASAAGFPIKAKEKVVGVLHLANKSKRHFTSDELQLLESIAHEIGVAAENAQLFEQINLKTAELASINQELDQANRAKSEFISAMSHELRTPLNVIMGNAELTGEGFWGEINAEQKKSMTQIRHHSQFLLKLVNNVLALSRLDAKKVSLELSTVHIDDLVDHAKNQVDQLNRNKGLNVSWDIDADLPEIVTDETKLEEILQNLIGNAFKFTDSGSIDVRVRNMAEEKRIEFCVADTGIGIEPQDLDRIFGAFEQIREAHTGEFNGVGLGLNIVKKFLDLMHGDISVESQLGKGSAFTFTVPHSIESEPISMSP
jgi:signal transduction histidine kinase